MTKRELWSSLRDYQFEDIVPPNLKDKVFQMFGGTNASLKAFAAKLAKKHNWSTEFALRVVEEYKRFVYLGVIAKDKFHVTPSKIVDEAWHEHCMFQMGYRRFRTEVIQHDFLHYPELIPLDSETEVYRDQYLKTVALYKREFGYLPPADIWARPKFSPRPDGIRARQRQHSAHKSKFAFDLEDLLDVLDTILDSVNIDDLPLRTIFDSDARTEPSTFPEFRSEPTHHTDLEAPSHSGHHSHSYTHEHSHTSEPSYDGGHSVSDTSDAGGGSGDSGGGSGCSSGCGGGGCGS
jgi:hypothetical protein